MHRANKLILGVLLASVAVPAFAADMPLKAPPPAAPPPPDWSGIYSGFAAGGAWGHQNFNMPSSINNLFGTSADRVFNGSSVLIQPDFDLTGACAVNGCNRFNTSGFIGGGFVGVQKQWGNWVVGIEGSWDWTSMKKSLSVTTSDLENVIRFDPTTTFPVSPVPVTVTGVIPAGQPVNFTIPAGTITSTGTATIAAGTVVTINAIGGVPVPPFTVRLGAPVTGTVTATNSTTVTFTGNAATATPITVTSTGTVPGQNITIPLPHETTVRATVTRSVDAEVKVDQIVDIRGKFGFTNTFLGPNWMLYFTGGAAIGHVERSLTLTQTVSVAGDGSRTNTFQSTTGDTRLGWVVGGGFDWMMTPNVILGVLYRHHEFPKGTVSFVDDSGATTRPVSFGTNRASVDSVQGRLSWLIPIH
jgi:opacity protein-like surface antigen